MAHLQHWAKGLFIWARLNGLARFPVSGFTSKSFVKFWCVHIRGRAGSVLEVSVLPTKFSASGLEILPYEHFIPATGWTAGWILAVRMASSCTTCCIFHIISIPFNSCDTALTVTYAKIDPKVKTFVLRYVCFVSRIWRQNSSPGSLTFSHLRNLAEISHMNPRQNSSRQPSQPGQPGSYEEALRVKSTIVTDKQCPTGPEESRSINCVL